ncbi:hypothetical protein Tco_0615662 [Tanacetum coccineum]
MSTPPPPHTLNLHGILSQSKQIVNAHSRHFLALSVLFILPLSFTIIISPTFINPLSQNDIVSTQFFTLNQTQSQSIQTLPIIIFTLFILTFFLSATATITYSTFHGFYGRPVKFLPALKSLFFTFLPLLFTALAAGLLLFLICLSFVLFAIVFVNLGQYLGLVNEYNSISFIILVTVFSVTLGVFLVCFYVNWCLASVIVVTESKWGFSPLWRSAYLVKGMRLVSLRLALVFGGLVGVWMWMCSSNVLRYDDVDVGWKSWGFVVQVVIGTSVLTLFLVYKIAADTVLYMYCKALHGELAIEIAEEFAREYVSLPFDDDKVPHVVTVFAG